MIDLIDARLARLTARHAELSQAIQNASVELAQVEGAHAHLTDLKKELEAAAAEVPHVVNAEWAAAEKAERDTYQRAMTRIGAAAEQGEADVFPVETRLQRELARNAEASK